MADRELKAMLIGVFGLLILFVVSLVIMGQPEKFEVLENGTSEFEITYIDPPKHVWVKLKKVDTGEVFERESVGKHFGGWCNVKIGTKIKLNWEKRKYESGKVQTHVFGVREAVRTLGE